MTTIRKKYSLAIAGLFAFLLQIAVGEWMSALAPGKIAKQSVRDSGWDTSALARATRFVSFGHLRAAVDWIWLQILIDSSVEKAPKGGHASVFYDLDLGTELDPAFLEFYVSGANLLAVIRDDGKGAEHLLSKGERFLRSELPSYPQSFQDGHWRDAWKLRVLQGYTYLFELDDMPRAAIAFREAAEFPRAPRYLERLAMKLESRAGEYEVGLRLLNFMMGTAKDAKLKEALERKRRSLFLSQYLFETNRSFRVFLDGIPKYRKSAEISRADLENYWNRFKKKSNLPALDPFGGRVYLDKHGRISSSTPYVKVFGLE